MIRAIQSFLAAFAPKRRPITDPRNQLPASIQDEILLKNWFRAQCKSQGAPLLRLESTASKFGDIKVERLKELPVELYTGIL
jgi:hypothetical protein